VPIIIRITVQDYDRISTAMNEEVLTILTAGEAAAQKASGDGLG
jgi:hypothetical protein